MSNPSVNRKSSKAIEPNGPVRKTIPTITLQLGLGNEIGSILDSKPASMSTSNQQYNKFLDKKSVSNIHTEVVQARKVSSVAYNRQVSPSTSRSALNTSSSTITLTPSERRCYSCSRLGAQLEEFNSRHSTPARQRSPSPVPVLCSMVATPSPPPSPAVDHRQRLVVAPTPPPFSPPQDYPYESEESFFKSERAISPRPERFQTEPDDVNQLSGNFSPTISIPSLAKPPVYAGFTPPKPPPLEPLLPARRREHVSPSSTSMSSYDATFNTPDKGVWVPTSPLRGTSFNRAGCPYLTRSMSPSSQDKMLTSRSISPKKTPIKPTPVKQTIQTPVNMYDHSVVLATPSSKPVRKGAPIENDVSSVSGTHSIPAPHGSSGIHTINYQPAYIVNNQEKIRHTSIEHNVPVNIGTPLRDNAMSIVTTQSTPTIRHEGSNTTQIVLVPVPMPSSQNQPVPPPAPIQQAPPPPVVQPSPQGYVMPQQVQQPIPPSPQYVQTPQVLSSSSTPIAQSLSHGYVMPQHVQQPIPATPQNIQYVQTPQGVYSNNTPVYVPSLSLQNSMYYGHGGYSIPPPMSTYGVIPAPYMPYPHTNNGQYVHVAAAPPMQYLYGSPHPVDSWWADHGRYN